jgi:hypothetical protein
MGFILFFDNFRSPNFNARWMVVNGIPILKERVLKFLRKWNGTAFTYK